MDCNCFENELGHFVSCPLQKVPRRTPSSPISARELICSRHSTLVGSENVDPPCSPSTTLFEVSPEPETPWSSENVPSFLSSGSLKDGVDVHDYLKDVHHPVSSIAVRAPTPTREIFHKTPSENSSSGQLGSCRLDWDPFDDLAQPVVLRGPHEAVENLLTLIQRRAKSQTTRSTGSQGDAETLLISMRAALGVNDASVVALQSDLELFGAGAAMTSTSGTFLLDLLRVKACLQADDLASILWHYGRDRVCPIQLGICYSLQVAVRDQPPTYGLRTVRRDPHQSQIAPNTVWVISNNKPSEQTFDNATVAGPTGQDYGDSDISRWSAIATDIMATRPSYATVVAEPAVKALKREQSPEYQPRVSMPPTNTSAPHGEAGTTHSSTRRFKTRAHSVASLRSIANIEQIVCPRAGCRYNPETKGWKKQSFSSRKVLEVHLRKVHDIDEADRPVPCKQQGCSRRFFYPKDEKRHRKLHTNGNNLFCHIVGCKQHRSHTKKGMRADNLRRHYQSVHPTEDVPTILLTTGTT